MVQRVLSLALLTAMLAVASVAAQEPPTTENPPEVDGDYQNPRIIRFSVGVRF